VSSADRKLTSTEITDDKLLTELPVSGDEQVVALVFGFVAEEIRCNQRRPDGFESSVRLEQKPTPVSTRTSNRSESGYPSDRPRIDPRRLLDSVEETLQIGRRFDTLSVELVVEGGVNSRLRQ
jgi:hypothetical protein